MRGRVLKKDLTFSVLSTLLCKRYVDLLFFYFFSGHSLVNISLLIFVPGFSHLFFFFLFGEFGNGVHLAVSSPKLWGTFKKAANVASCSTVICCSAKQCEQY